jgi:catechol 2,3-dioxygenase-like lactoylglutathione lyase family enzyme
MPPAQLFSMMTLTSMPSEAEVGPDEFSPGANAAKSACYSITIFTQRWKEVRDFYVDLLGAHVLSERTERYCEVDLGGVPLTIRMAEHGEIVSYFHLYISTRNRDNVLAELRRRGIIVTTVGPYTNFRDPEGRVIKLSEEKTIVS